MSYEVTATRKRPSSFELLAGQEFVVSTLKNSIAAGRIARAYLFAGPRGVGKTSAARILARALNCARGPTPEPCGVCPSCVEIARGAALDVIEIDGASNTSVNDVRQIKDEVLFAPNSGRYKIYIIDEVHMLSNSAFNALLKTIEEPPPHVVFMFATTEIHKVPATIRSRCQQFNFRLIGLDTIRGLLRGLCDETGISAQDEALLWIAKEATGSLRDAYTLFDQVVSFSGGDITMEGIRDKLGLVGLDRINGIAELLAAGDAREALTALDGILAAGVSIESFVGDLTEYFRNILFLKNGVTRESILGCGADRFSPKVVGTFQPRQIEKALSLLFELYRNLRYSLNQRFELELAVSCLGDLTNFLSNEELHARILALRRELSSLEGTPGGAPGSGPGGEDSPGAAPSGSSFAPRPESATHGATAPGTGERAAPMEEAPAASPEPGAGAVAPEKKAALLGILKNKLALRSALEKALAWRLEGNLLELGFDDKFSADFVTRDLGSLSASVREVFGAEVRVSIRVGKETGTPAGPEGAGEGRGRVDDEQVEIAKKVFRGEVIT